MMFAHTRMDAPKNGASSRDARHLGGHRAGAGDEDQWVEQSIHVPWRVTVGIISRYAPHQHCQPHV